MCENSNCYDELKTLVQEQESSLVTRKRNAVKKALRELGIRDPVLGDYDDVNQTFSYCGVQIQVSDYDSLINEHTGNYHLRVTYYQLLGKKWFTIEKHRADIAKDLLVAIDHQREYEANRTYVSHSFFKKDEVLPRIYEGPRGWDY